MKSMAALRMSILVTGFPTKMNSNARTITAAVVMPMSRTSVPGLRLSTRGMNTTPMTAPMPTTPEMSPIMKLSVTFIASTIEGTKKMTP